MPGERCSGTAATFRAGRSVVARDGGGGDPWVAGGPLARAGTVPRAGGCAGAWASIPHARLRLLLMLPLSLVFARLLRLRTCHRSAVHSMISRVAWPAASGFSDLLRHPPGA